MSVPSKKLRSGADGEVAAFNDIGRCLIVTLQSDISGEYFERLGEDTAHALRRNGYDSIIFDLTAVELIDVNEFNRIRQICDMTSLMGTAPCLIGIRPGIAAALVELGAKTDGLDAFLNLGMALDALNQLPPDC